MIIGKVKTRIEIKGVYPEAIMNCYNTHTKTEAVNLALRCLAVQPMTREATLSMRVADSIDEILAEG